MSILYIVATPIGNLSDISLRAIEILKSVDIIAAEDTRHSARLLRHIDVQNKLIAFHEHNESDRTESLINSLLSGQSVALISDAGTPLLSDPGYQLVKRAKAVGIQVSPIPGACAIIAALSVAGLPSDRFCFEGFLPYKQSARISVLTELLNEPRTLIFYESPHRILDALNDIQSVLGGQRFVVIARELTKTFETVHGDEVAKLIDWMQADTNQQLGEFVLLIKGAEKSHDNVNDLKVLKILLEELPVKQAVNLAVKITGAKKNELYDLAIKYKNE
jgi:16S rRNA (cytidine1402-2'-O)-methyltransferase